MITLGLSPIPLILLGVFQISRPVPSPRYVDTPVEYKSSSAEYTSREVNLARFVFTEEELAERRAARNGGPGTVIAYPVQSPVELAAQIGKHAKKHRRYEEGTVSNAYFYRTKNAWNRSDINGDGRGWGSQHPRSLSVPAGNVVSD
jgi:hypothetical protein